MDEKTGRTVLHDKAFRRIVVVSTAISFAATAAVGASFRMDQRMFVWHWSIIPFMAIGACAAWYLWKLAFEAQTQPSSRNKFKFVGFSILLALIAIAGFLSPVFLVQHPQIDDLVKGLVTAAVFLTALAWFFWKFMHGFEDADEIAAKKFSLSDKKPD